MALILLLLSSSLLIGISGFIAWRYAKSEIDPDWALFNMAAFTGSWYGRDFPDCKTPGIHLWYYAIAKLVGADIFRVRFAHHFIIGLGSLPIMYLTNSFWNGLAFAILVNSGWLFAFHGNVSQLPAVFIAFALLADNPWVALFFFGMAAFQEPKLIPSMLIAIAVYGWWIPAGVYIVATFLIFVTTRKTQVFGWIWESSYVIPKLMHVRRKKERLYPAHTWFAALGWVYILPWLFAAAIAKPDPLYWLPAAAYLIMIGLGMVMRPIYMLPLAAWIALAGIDPVWILALSCFDYIASGFYLSNIWGTFYSSIMVDLIAAHHAGEWLRDKKGTLLVNDYMTNVYIHARKPVEYGMAEQAEINTVLVERRDELKRRWKEKPADWVVMGSKPGLKFVPNGYAAVKRFADLVIFERQ